MFTYLLNDSRRTIHVSTHHGVYVIRQLALLIVWRKTQESRRCVFVCALLYAAFYLIILETDTSHYLLICI